MSIQDPLTRRPRQRDPLRARIVSDGTPDGTHVFLADGTELTQVQAVTWELSAGEEFATITVQLGLGQLQAHGRLDMSPGPTPRRTP